MLVRREDFARLYEAMDAVPEMRGAGVVYMDGKATNMLRASAHGTGLDTYLVMQEIDLADGPEKAPPKPARLTNGQMLADELIGAGLNCGAMVLLGVASAGSAVCTVGTAGACSPVMVLSAIGAAATGAQCGISIGRVAIAVADPRSIGLSNLDSQAWYQGVSIGLEVGSFVGTAASGVGALGRLRAMKDARSGAQLTLLMNPGQKATYGKGVANYMRVAAQDARNGITLRWLRNGKAAAIFKDLTGTLNVAKLQAFMDLLSNAMGVYSNLRSGESGKLVSSAMNRGLHISLIQTQDSAPSRPDPPGYAFAMADIDPVPDTGYPNPFNLPYDF